MAKITREDKIKQIFTNVGAFISDTHVVYTSGQHGSTYFNKDALYVNPLLTREICKIMAEDFQNQDVETVVGPALGGIILSHDTAAALSEMTGNVVKSVYAEKDGNGGFVFTRGYDQFVNGKKVLVVEDVLTTGGSVRKVIELCKVTGADVVGLSVLCNRGNVTPEQVGNVPLKALLDIQWDTWEKEKCPLCKSGVEINIKVGKGAAFLKQQS